MESGEDLVVLNGLTVERIYEVDYNNDRHSDGYLPWLFFLTFKQFDKYLRIEGDLDGSAHIKIELKSLGHLDSELEENHFPDEIDHWQVYKVEPNELLGNLLEKTIQFCEYGVEREIYDCSDIGKIGEDLFMFINLSSI